MNIDKNQKSNKSVKQTTIAGQDLIGMSDFHPFKSLKAKKIGRAHV